MGGGESIFDGIGEDDIIFAFFPCTRFECQITLNFRGEAFRQANWTESQKLEYSMQLHNELHRNYRLISELALIAINRGLKLIIENPYTPPHYLTTYWCIKPKLVDGDRTRNGDYMKKPTQFFFINCEPENNILMEPIEYVEKRSHEGMKMNDDGFSRQEKRSMLHPQYANRFIRQFILNSD